MNESDQEKRKEYIRNVYSKTWSRKRKKYGFIQYDKDLIHELSKRTENGKILEVGIGDGFPFSQKLDEIGYEVFGVDISPIHVDLVKKSLPNIHVEVGDSEDLQFSKNFFDIVFCFRSTWYFPNLIKSIREMLRVVKINGLVMFDIQNINHPIHKKEIKKRIFRLNHPIIDIGFKYIKNVIKILLKPAKYYPLDWSIRKTPIIETPTDPNNVNTYLESRGDVEYKLYGVKWGDSFTLEEIKKTTDLDLFDRLAYRIIKISL